MARSGIPVHSIDDYGPHAGLSIHVSRFEESIQNLTNRVELHRHRYYEVFWLQGTGIHLNDFRNYEINGNTLIFVTPGQVHAWARHENLEGWMVAFTQEFFDSRCQPPSEILDFPFWFPEDGSPLLPVPSGVQAECDNLMDQIRSEFGRKENGYENAIRWLLRTLFVKAARVHESSADPRTQAISFRTVREFRLMLESHFSALQKVGDYAKQLDLSADRLSALTREHTGFTAGELIRDRLLLEARRLLAHTDLTMSEIAYRLNFQDPSYFSRFFRKQTGEAPGDFRISIRRRCCP